MPVITIADAADYLRIDPAERGLRFEVDGVNAYIRDYCRRQFDKERLTEYHDVSRGDVSEIWVLNPPIITLHSVTDDANTTEFTTRSNRSIDVDLDVNVPEPDRNRIRLVNHESVFVQGVQTTKIVYTGGYEQQAMPRDLVLAALNIVRARWQNPGAAGRDSENTDGQGIVYSDEQVPTDARKTLDRYTRLTL